jgi:hypothetical protein
MSHLNLLPDSYVKQRMRHRIDLACVLLFAVVMGGSVVADVMGRKKAAQSQRDYGSVLTRYAAGVTFVTHFLSMESEKGKLQSQIKKAAQLGDVVPRSYLLGLLTRARNGEMYLRRVEFAVVEFEASASESSSGTRRTQSSSAGRSPKTPKVKAPMRKLIRIRVDGYASNSAEISQFHQALKREPMIENIEQGYSRGVLIDKKPWINFDLMMEVPLDGDTPLVKRGGSS